MDRRAFFKKLVPVGQEDLESGLLLSNAMSETGMAVVELSEEICFAHKGSICFSCREVCPEDAILFSGMFKPMIVEENCTGCGLCIPVCPASAIASRNITGPPSDDQMDSFGSHLTGLNDLLA